MKLGDRVEVTVRWSGTCVTFRSEVLAQTKAFVKVAREGGDPIWAHRDDVKPVTQAVREALSK
jgi:hypothetical protein